METNDQRRRRKLGELANTHGLEALAKAARETDATLKTSAASLKQVVQGYASSFELGNGSRSERGLGDRVARAIETAFQLGTGWFDNDIEQMLTPEEQHIMGLYRRLSEASRQMVLESMNRALAGEQRLAERMRSQIKPPPEVVLGRSDKQAPAAPKARRR